MSILLLAVCTFCSLVGYRLLFNRPNQHGGLLTSKTWMVLAGFFWLSGLLFAMILAPRGEHGSLVGVVGLGVIGYWCFKAARAQVSIIPTPTVFPPETSLLGIEGFVPPGFECGIEILNDERSTMVFVVEVLQNKLGMSEADAIKKMLEIHEKGGILLATSTPEEAARIAESITAEAREKNQPLVCRAVTNSSKTAPTDVPAGT